MMFISAEERTTEIDKYASPSISVFPLLLFACILSFGISDNSDASSQNDRSKSYIMKQTASFERILQRTKEYCQMNLEAIHNLKSSDSRKYKRAKDIFYSDHKGRSGNAVRAFKNSSEIDKFIKTQMCSKKSIIDSVGVLGHKFVYPEYYATHAACYIPDNNMKEIVKTWEKRQYSRRLSSPDYQTAMGWDDVPDTFLNISQSKLVEMIVEKTFLQKHCINYFKNDFYTTTITNLKKKEAEYRLAEKHRKAKEAQAARKRAEEKRLAEERIAEIKRQHKAKEQARNDKIVAQRTKIFDATNIPSQQHLIWGASDVSTYSGPRNIEYFINELNRTFIENVSSNKAPKFNPPSKGEFEKTADYKARVLEAQEKHQVEVANQLEEFKKRIPAKRQSYFSAHFGKAMVSNVIYDADRETFSLSVGNQSSDYSLKAVLPVPIADAPAMKKKIEGASPWVLYSFNGNALKAEKLVLQCVSKDTCAQPETYVPSLSKDSQVAHSFGKAALLKWSNKVAKMKAATAEKKRVADNSPERKELRKAALSLLHHHNYGLKGLCDKIYDPILRNVTYGTLTSWGGNTRFPAIVANYDFDCISPMTGDRDRKTKFWVVLGHDDAGGKYRCLKIAGKSVINDMQDQCDFRSE